MCRTREGPQYLASVAVIWTEVIKLGICVAAQSVEVWKTAGDRGLSLGREARHQAQEILGQSYPMLLPAGLFVMQQVLPCLRCRPWLRGIYLSVSQHTWHQGIPPSAPARCMSVMQQVHSCS